MLQRLINGFVRETIESLTFLTCGTGSAQDKLVPKAKKFLLHH